MPSENFSLVSSFCCSLDKKVNSAGMDSIHPDGRAVCYIWDATGVLENGSFQYFYENKMDALTAALAFEALGYHQSAECFRLAESLLPVGHANLPWAEQRIFLDKNEETLDILAKKILTDTADAENRLAEFIRERPYLIVELNSAGHP